MLIGCPPNGETVTEFISPNWHVILVHYPLALLTLGVVIELFAFLWKRSSVRAAARWMILFGALALIPAATTGLYAFNEAVRGAAASPGGNWQEAMETARWTKDAEWLFMNWHIWLTTGATAIFAIAAITYLASSDAWRRRLHLPALALMVIGLAATSIGAWFSGESVYRFGVAVKPYDINEAANISPEDPWHLQIQRFVPPMQAHTLFAGFAAAVGLLATGLTIRRWTAPPAQPSPGTITDPGSLMYPSEANKPDALPSPRVHPARFWLIASALALVTAAAAVWYAETDWEFSHLTRLFTDARFRDEHFSLFVHVIAGAGIILLPLILAALTRFARGLKALTLAIMLVMLAAILAQTYYGIVLLYGMGEAH